MQMCVCLHLYRCLCMCLWCLHVCACMYLCDCVRACVHYMKKGKIDSAKTRLMQCGWSYLGIPFTHISGNTQQTTFIGHQLRSISAGHQHEAAVLHCGPLHGACTHPTPKPPCHHPSSSQAWPQAHPQTLSQQPPSRQNQQKPCPGFPTGHPGSLWQGVGWHHRECKLPAKRGAVHTAAQTGCRSGLLWHGPLSAVCSPSCGGWGRPAGLRASCGA